ncbi:MAG: hypothetical protein ACI4M5_03960 [Christensenellales bacterium]
MNKRAKIFDFLGYVAAFVASLILLIICAQLRRYIYDNINAAFTFGRLGMERLSISTLVPILLAVGVAVGALGVFLLRKKITHKTVNIACLVASVCLAVTLIFTPYNIQLLAPDQNLQNVTSFNLIAVIVFATITVAVLSFEIGSYIMLTSNGNSNRAIAVTACCVVESVIAIIVTYFNLSFVVVASVLTVVLFGVATARIMLHSDEDAQEIAITSHTHVALQSVVLAVCVVVVMIVGFFVTDQAILF